MSSLLTGLTRRSMTFASTMAQSMSAGAMNSLVLIVRKGGYDQTSREYDTDLETVIYDHPTLSGVGYEAGVTPTSGPMNMDIGDEPQYYDNISIFIPQHAAFVHPRIDDIATIMSSPESDIEGRLFRITGVPVGGRIFSSIQLSAVGIAPSKQWAL